VRDDYHTTTPDDAAQFAQASADLDPVQPEDVLADDELRDYYDARRNR
jgi:hypothetical protein